MLRTFLIVLALFAIGQALLSVDSTFNVLRDEYNRIRVMKGVNSVYK